MTGDGLAGITRKLAQRRPFRRYRIHVVDGRTLTVEHPDLLGIYEGVAGLMDLKGRQYSFEADTVSCVEESPDGLRREKQKAKP